MVCAVVGSILGVTHPLGSILPGERRAEPSSDLSLASIKLVDETPSAGQQMPSFRSMIPRRGVVSLRIRQSIMVVPSRARRNFAAFQPTL